MDSAVKRNKNIPPVLLGAVPILFAGVVGAACSEQSDDADLPGLVVGGAPSGGSGVGGAASTGVGGGLPPGGGLASGNTAGSSGVIVIPPTNGGGSGAATGGGDFAKCATSTSMADLRPVNMFIQFDRSGSMMYENDGTLLAVDKWAQAVSALTSFFTDVESDGLSIALRFFPHNDPAAGCVGATLAGRGGGGTPMPMPGMSCDPVACAQPLVPLGTLLAAPGDPQESALLAALAGATPNSPSTPEGQTYTPMYPALEGALQWARTMQAQKPEERFVVVLVTDGDPTACEIQIPRIAALAEAARMEAGINTYAIGIQGSQEDTMNQIAVAGGTERAYFSGDAQTAQRDLLAALKQIRGNVLTCNYQFPVGDNVDINKINVQFTGPGAMSAPLARTEATKCDAGGWYYDNPTAPTSISLCESTCQQVQGAGQAKIEIVVGCETRVR
jgi:hypothetical protein